MFWTVVGALILLVLVPVGRVLLRAPVGVASAAEQDVAVYKDQLSEVDRDLARGVLGQDEAEANFDDEEETRVYHHYQLIDVFRGARHDIPDPLPIVDMLRPLECINCILYPPAHSPG